MYNQLPNGLDLDMKSGNNQNMLQMKKELTEVKEMAVKFRSYGKINQELERNNDNLKASNAELRNHI
jgi:hypothetical protein